MTTPGTDRRLGGRYRLTERIAVGGMGEVWRGRDKVLGRASRSSCCAASTPTTRRSSTRFRNEARHTAALSHPGIAPVYDYGEDGTAPPTS